MTLKELLECEFTINENGIMVGEIPLERINKIADILTEQKQRIDKAIEYIKNHNLDFKRGTTTRLEALTMQEKELLEILGDKE